MLKRLVTQQSFTAEQAAAGVLLFGRKTCLFQKGTLGGPQALFSAAQAAAGYFSQQNNMPQKKKVCSGQTLTIFINSLSY